MNVKQNIEASYAKNKLNGTHSVVTFKGDFLGKLIDAVALIEVVELIIKNHDEFDFDKPGMLGMSILVEQIRELLDIKENLLAEND